MRRGGISVNVALWAIALFAVAPLAWMVSVSLMNPGEASSFPPPLLPHHATFANFVTLFASTDMARYLVNSFVLGTLATILSLTFNVAAGYAFAKLRFRGRDRLFRLLLTALVIPAQVAMIPLFLICKMLGVINSFAGVLIPSIASVFGIFLVRQYALSIPDEMIEAARIDGASEVRIFRSIVLPTLKPILATLATFSFLGAWSDFLWPLIILNDSRKYTLPVALANLSREHVQDVELMMAGSVVTLVPVLLLFLVLQRYYIAGLMAGSVKG
ncbi:carbohydrate ABC transporter permease [Sphingomonas sp.]|jgi:multiple sugar transport system permease protein|uniref:carbohydrate ABC transporter permease n=1 Tax=Sphingomonas sp. TaxID=28214 RepID=UPI002E36DBD3|nr:carbohydrate ABC transporter permease [Sphingomonas sp.]HEX4695629.1 carbohydrate ABC transporter permease [Sphingomonas sp.]